MAGTPASSRTGADRSAAPDRLGKVQSSNIGELMLRAHALLEEGQPEESLRTFERVLAIQPDLVEARSARGALLVGFNRIDEGLQEIDWVLMKRPRDPQAWYNKACAHSLRREGPPALDALVRAVAAFPPYRATAAEDSHFEFLRGDAGLASRFRALTGGVGHAPAWTPSPH
jgi:tetratricopeptide (TPR) repeat protein